jgi:adenylate kinase family enzyme
MDVLKFFLTGSQVRGTPGAGKTSLAELLEYHITQQEPTTHLIWMQGWPHDDIKARGHWRHYFEIEKGWVENQKTVFVFDEAQLLYVDGDLWNNFLQIHTPLF